MKQPRPLRRRSADARHAVVKEMVRVLERRYGGEDWLRHRGPSDPLDGTMRAILSQNTNDENRDRAYGRLRKRFPTWEAVMEADPESVVDAIRVGGLANQKAPNMQGFLRWLKAERGELNLDFLCDLPVEKSLRLLTAHRGIGIKTVYVVLAFACGKDVCAVDTHIHRVLRRIGLIDERCGREKAHLKLAPLIPRGKARSFHINLLDFGKEICGARRPDCPDCPFTRRCRFFSETGGTPGN